MPKEKMNLYHRERQFNRLLDWIKTTKEISEHNKKLLLNFKDKAEANDISITRIVWYLNKLKVILTKYTKKDIDKLTRKDIENIIIKIKKYKSYSEWTIAGYKITIKKFIQIIKGYEWFSKEYPPEVKWLKMGVKNNKKKLPKTILTVEEIKRMISGSKNDRDRAMLAVLYDSGARVGEPGVQNLLEPRYIRPCLPLLFHSPDEVYKAVPKLLAPWYQQPSAKPSD